MITQNSFPFVSIIMPVRNESGYIRTSVGSVLNQDYPPDRMEIIIIDGMSNDGTREIIKEISDNASQTDFQLLDNPEQITPKALNTGIKAANGDYILRVDGHCKLPPNYIQTCIKHLQNGEAENVGGMQKPVGLTYFGQAVALATSSPLFIGNSYFRYSEKKQFVDTVYLGAYPREVFEDIGLFDTELDRHQDYEFNLRLRLSGGKILYIPDLEVKYYPRTNLIKFFKQYYGYGFWKVRVMQKSNQAFRLRHFPPTMFSIGVILGALLSLLIPWLRIFYFGGLLLYVFLAMISSLYVSLSKKQLRYLPLLPVLFAVIHFGWGLGFWAGMYHWHFSGIEKEKKEF